MKMSAGSDGPDDIWTDLQRTYLQRGGMPARTGIPLSEAVYPEKESIKMDPVPADDLA